jgi:hypothetical protein
MLVVLEWGAAAPSETVVWGLDGGGVEELVTSVSVPPQAASTKVRANKATARIVTSGIDLQCGAVARADGSSRLGVMMSIAAPPSCPIPSCTWAPS